MQNWHEDLGDEPGIENRNEFYSFDDRLKISLRFDTAEQCLGCKRHFQPKDLEITARYEPIHASTIRAEVTQVCARCYKLFHGYSSVA